MAHPKMKNPKKISKIKIKERKLLFFMDKSTSGLVPIRHKPAFPLKVRVLK
jgi:hypothetical protein